MLHFGVTKCSYKLLASTCHAYCQVNEFVKRVRAAKIHILIMGHLRKKMPAMMGKAKAQEKLLANLQAEFGMVQREYHLPAGKCSITSDPSIMLRLPCLVYRVETAALVMLLVLYTLHKACVCLTP